MTVTVQVLFDQPRRQIASLLRGHLTRCVTASLVSGFMTVEGIEAIAAPLRAHPGKLAHLVVGAGTWRAFDALDRLRAAGVAASALYVHLGHTRPTGTRRHPFVRYHPMLHSKIYLLDMGNGQAAAFVGSHNLTGFALHGMNGEAGVLLEGPANAPQFVALRQHVDEAVRQATPYDPGKKPAYAWWTMQFIDGLHAEANGDLPKDGEAMRTIVVLAACTSGRVPRPGQLIYFEIPEALDRIQSMQAEVHIYVFPTLPPTSSLALASLGTASTRLSCNVEGIEAEQGGIELRADWHIDNRRRPELKPTVQPFRPTPASGMRQVRVRVQGAVTSQYEYLFDPGKSAWEPIYDPESALVDGPWRRVCGLRRADPAGSDARQLALWESTPESDAYILFSPRRRKLTPR